jgi:hypothetical protein
MITTRPAQPKDMPQLIALHAKQNRRDKTRYPLAEIFDEDGRQAENIPMALVTVRDDEVLGAMIFEAKGLEMMLVGCNPRATVIARRERDGILYTLRAMGFQWIRCLVTKSVVKILSKPMKDAGFRRDDRRFASFFREI